MFCGQSKSKKCGASRKVGPSPFAKGSCGEDDRSCREKRDWQVRHNDGEVRGDGRVDGEEKESAEGNYGIEDALEGECEGQHEETVQSEHAHTRAALDRVGIVLAIDRAFGKGSFADLVVVLAEGIQTESGCSDEAADPKFHERWMLGIDAEIVVTNVGYAGGDVIGLINSEAVQARGDGGTQDGYSNQQ